MVRILLVEDNDMNRDVLGRLLQRRGYEVAFAKDGESAVETALGAQVDLILMDISLPGIDGFEASRRIRAHPVGAQVPIIALTAHTSPSDRQHALDAGCTDFEPKPLEFKRLMVKLEHHLGRRPA